MGLIRKAFDLTVLLLEDTIDRIGDPRIAQRALEARDRAAELMLENARLEADNLRLNEELSELRGELAFNGPTLYSDEVVALRKGVKALYDTDDDYDPTSADALTALLKRSDHFGITQKELYRRADDAINGIGVASFTPAQPEGRIPEEFWKDDNGE